jgi:hypothetical protein
MTALRGRLHRNTITLEATLPSLEGKEVRILIEPVEEADLELSPVEQARLWREWAAHGPEGPIENDGETEFP